MTPEDVVKDLYKRNFPVIYWPTHGDTKGPQQENWPTQAYPLEGYKPDYRVGVLTGKEVSPGHYLHDVDIDWAEGMQIAGKMLPFTGFAFGRPSKPISHCFYFLSAPLPSETFTDILLAADKKAGRRAGTLLELRGTTKEGTIRNQTMVPPSVWTKNGAREQLAFVRHDPPTFYQDVVDFRRKVVLTAIAMLLSKYFGHNGFGHDPRLCWAGFMLAIGVTRDEAKHMGLAISSYCNNLEMDDVARSVDSTYNRGTSPHQKIKGTGALIKLLGDEVGQLVVKQINNWLGRDKDFIRNKAGDIIKDSQENIDRAAQLLDTYFAYDEFAARMLVKTRNTPSWVPLDDFNINDLWLQIDTEFRFRPPREFFEFVLMRLTHNNSFHPVKDYLTGLQWDGVPRVETWLARYAKAEDTEYTHTIGKLFLVAAVRRIMKPGCKFDEMIVLESPQGFSKSTFLRTLCPNDDWFSDDLPLNIDSKQMIEKTLGKWIIEASDLAGKRKADLEHLKATMSRQVDGPARLAYARIPVERRRHFIIAGTTNSAAYLADSTGSRRFWPCKVGRLDLTGLAMDRDQLWAEAVKMEARGDSIRLPEHLWKVAGDEQELRRELDAWESVIETYLEGIEPASSGRKQVITDRLWEMLGIEAARRDRLGSMRISEIMQRFGYHRGRVRENGEVKVGYLKEAPSKLDLE